MDLKARWPGCYSHALLCAEHTRQTVCSAHHPGNPPSLASEPSQAFNRAALPTPTISKYLKMPILACSTKQRCFDRGKNVFVYMHDYPPLQGPVEGGRAGR